jgi:hypothetical protein
MQSFTTLAALLRSSLTTHRHALIWSSGGLGRRRNVGGRLVVVEVLTYQTLHVETTGSEDSFEVDRTQSHGHLSLVVGVVELRHVHLLHILSRLLSDKSIGFGSFFCGDFLHNTKHYSSIEIKKSWQFFDHSDAIPRFPIQDISCEFKFFEVGKFCQFFNIIELCNFI